MPPGALRLEAPVNSLLPPRKRDWKPGTYQVGVFIRTNDGMVLEMVTMNPASKRQIELAFELARTPCRPPRSRKKR